MLVYYLTTHVSILLDNTYVATSTQEAQKAMDTLKRRKSQSKLKVNNSILHPGFLAPVESKFCK